MHVFVCVWRVKVQRWASQKYLPTNNGRCRMIGGSTGRCTFRTSTTTHDASRMQCVEKLLSCLLDKISRQASLSAHQVCPNSSETINPSREPRGVQLCMRVTVVLLYCCSCGCFLCSFGNSKLWRYTARASVHFWDSGHSSWSKNVKIPARRRETSVPSPPRQQREGKNRGFPPAASWSFFCRST